MLTVTRTQKVDGRFRTAHNVRDFPNSHFPDEFDSIYSVDGFIRSFEEKSIQKGNTRDNWNGFEHYQSVLADRPAMSSKPCQHARIFGFDVVHHAVHDDPFYGILPTSTYGALGVFDGGLPKFYDKRSDGGFVPPPAQLDDLVQRALRSMLPGPKAELSLINSTYELKDFETLPKTIEKVKALSSTYRIGAYTLKRFFRAAADGYLQLKFNLLPLLSDVQGVLKALHLHEKRIRALLADEGKLRTRHYTVPFVENADTNTENVLLSSDARNWLGPAFEGPSKGRRVVFNVPTVFHAEIEYSFTFTQYQREHALVLSLLDEMGVNLNPQIIWNAIPWSFVVDWLIGVGQWLSNFKIRNMEPRINISRFLWSVRRERQIQISTQVGDGSSVFRYPQPPWSLVARVDQSAYRRTVTLPSTSSIISSGLSLQEFSLGAALAISLGDRPKRKSWSHG